MVIFVVGFGKVIIVSFFLRYVVINLWLGLLIEGIFVLLIWVIVLLFSNCVIS